jgi:hypothetical protein
MKLIILSVLTMLFTLSVHAEKLPQESVPKDCSKNPLVPACTTTAPVNALMKIFGEPDDVLLSRVTAKDSYTIFQTPEHEIYLHWINNADRSMKDKLLSENKLKHLRMHHGKNRTSECYYDYIFSKNSTNTRTICSAKSTPEMSFNCKTIMAKDPLLQKEARCNEFIEALLACSADGTYEKCQNTFYNRAEAYDKLHPEGGVLKQRPSSNKTVK